MSMPSVAVPDLRPLEVQKRTPLKTAEEWRELFADLDSLQAQITQLRTLVAPVAFGNPTDDELHTVSQVVYDHMAGLDDLNRLADAIEGAVNDVVQARGVLTHAEELELVALAQRQAQRDAYTGPKPKVGDKVWQPDSARPEIYTVVEVVEDAAIQPVRATDHRSVVRYFDYFSLTAVSQAMLADYYKTVVVVPDYVPKVGDRVKVTSDAAGIWWETGTVEDVGLSCPTRTTAKVRFPIGGVLLFDFCELAPADKVSDAAAD